MSRSLLPSTPPRGRAVRVTQMGADFERALRQAEWLAGPPQPWSSEVDKRRRRRALMAIAVLMGSAAVVGSAMWSGAGNGHARPAIAPAPVSASTIGTPSTSALPAATPAESAASQPLHGTGAHADLRRTGRELAIDVRGLAIDDVMRMLAEATSSTVHLEAAHAVPPRLVNWSWRGHDGFDAWQSLLGVNMSYASRCDGLRCELWVAGEVPPIEAAAATSVAIPVAKPPIAPAPAAPEDLPQDEVERLAFGDAQ